MGEVYGTRGACEKMIRLQTENIETLLLIIVFCLIK